MNKLEEQKCSLHLCKQDKPNNPKIYTQTNLTPPSPKLFWTQRTSQSPLLLILEDFVTSPSVMSVLGVTGLGVFAQFQRLSAGIYAFLMLFQLQVTRLNQKQSLCGWLLQCFPMFFFAKKRKHNTLDYTTPSWWLIASHLKKSMCLNLDNFPQ